MTTPHYRPAAAADLPAMVQMVERCSQATLNSRFNGPRVSPAMASSWLRQALHDRNCASWSAIAGGAIVGMASACRQEREVEVALLVEDAWQARGVGGELLCRLVAAERCRGATHLRATMAADRLALARSLSRKVGVDLQCTIARGEAEITAELSETARGDTPRFAKYLGRGEMTAVAP